MSINDITAGEVFRRLLRRKDVWERSGYSSILRLFLSVVVEKTVYHVQLDRGQIEICLPNNDDAARLTIMLRPVLSGLRCEERAGPQTDRTPTWYVVAPLAGTD